MSENAIDGENISKPAPDTAKPKGARKPQRKPSLRRRRSAPRATLQQATGDPRTPKTQTPAAPSRTRANGMDAIERLNTTRPRLNRPDRWRGPITHRWGGTGGARVLLSRKCLVAPLDSRVVAKVSVLQSLAWKKFIRGTAFTRLSYRGRIVGPSEDEWWRGR
jgi:hypothetical protein